MSIHVQDKKCGKENGVMEDCYGMHITDCYKNVYNCHGLSVMWEKSHE